MRSVWIAGITLICVTFAGWAGIKAYRDRSPAAVESQIPTTVVKRGDVTFSITAKGELQGGKSMMLGAPMAGGVQLVITSLRDPGALVKAGETVVEFDTTELIFNRREAEADLAEVEQQLRKAEAENQAHEELARFAIIRAESELRVAELETRRNDIVAAIVARQNDLAVESARDRLRQLQEDVANRRDTSKAGIAIQEAARNKAQVKAEMTRSTIDAMTLRAPADGYVAIRQNTSGSIMFGMQPPMFQLGDAARPGMAVAEVLDLEGMRVSARIGELDRGHLAVGQKAKITVIATPGHGFSGTIVNIGNTTGPPWDRRFECKLSVDDSIPELRPGMSAKVEVITAQMTDELWLPSQAVFDRDGQKFVYRQGNGAFSPVDVELMRSGESQVVIGGVNEGDVVALADPTLRVDTDTSSSAADSITPK